MMRSDTFLISAMNSNSENYNQQKEESKFDRNEIPQLRTMESFKQAEEFIKPRS